MKTLLLNLCALGTLLTVTSCGDKPKEVATKDAETAAIAEATAEPYVVNTDASVIEWTGYKPTGSHAGTLAIASGKVAVNAGIIESGDFVIDMKSLEVTDIPKEEEANANLAGHLMNEDFFDVEAYPTAKFEVTGIATVEGKTMLSGNLTLKDATNNISFPVSTEINDGKMTLTSETFTIDRSKWNVKYGSKSFFEGLGDKFINDDVSLKVSLTATKA